jgi:hypothetical protein
MGYAQGRLWENCYNEWHWNLESSSGKKNPHGNGQISTSPKHRSNLQFGWLFNIFHRQQVDVRENHGIQHLNPSNIIYTFISSMKLKAQFGLKQRWRRSQLFARVCEIALVAHVATLGMPVFAHLREFQGVSGLLCRHLTKEKVQQLWCVLSQILHYRHFKPFWPMTSPVLSHQSLGFSTLLPHRVYTLQI